MGRSLQMGTAALVAALVVIAVPGTKAAAQEVLAARTLRVGTVLTASDLVPPDKEMTGRVSGNGTDDAAGAETGIAALLGLETRRAIYTGRPVTAADLGPPTLVRRNAMVVMLFTSGGLGIRTEGRALDSGGAGEAVRVLNLASRQSVLATVTGMNKVEVRR